MSKETTVVSFTETLKAKIEAEIVSSKSAKTYRWHLNRRAGLSERSLIIRYQIVQILEALRGKAFKKYRKHYNDHKVALRAIDAMPYYVTNEKGKQVNNYNAISKAYEELMERLEESANIIAESGKGKDLKLRKFKTLTAAIKADVKAKLDGKSEEEVIVEHEEAKVA